MMQGAVISFWLTYDACYPAGCIPNQAGPFPTLQECIRASAGGWGQYAPAVLDPRYHPQCVERPMPLADINKTPWPHPEDWHPAKPSETSTAPGSVATRDEYLASL